MADHDALPRPDTPDGGDEALAARLAAHYRREPGPRPGQAADCAAAVLARVAAGERPIDLPVRASGGRPVPRPRWWWGAAAAAVLVAVVTARSGHLRPGAGERDSLPPVGETAPTRTDPVRFAITLPDQAGEVAIVGDFNGWDAEATPLRRDRAAGTWSVVVPLPPGRHMYAFVVDGTRWLVDPLAPQVPDAGFGPTNAVVVAGHGTGDAPRGDTQR
jgi:hypothetical protein